MKIRRVGPDPYFVPDRTRARKRRASSRQAEHLEQKALFQWALQVERQLPELRNLFAVPNGGDRHPAVAAKLKAEGVRRGVPDVMLAWVVRDERGQIMAPGLYIEMKAGRNRPTPEQLDWRSRLIAAGYSWWVCYSWKDAANAILEYLGPKYVRRHRVV